VPQPFLGCLPFVQSLPLARDRAPLSRPHTPVQSSTGVQRRARSRLGIPPWFHRLPRSRAVAWIPHEPGSPFGERTRLPVAPDPARPRPPRSASFTCFEVLIPPASPFAPPRASPRWRPMLSWSSPFTAFSAHASGPLTRSDPLPALDPRPRSPSDSSSARDRRPTQPHTAGHPTARARPGPLTDHAPRRPRARDAQ
jgi:hypothetical protein